MLQNSQSAIIPKIGQTSLNWLKVHTVMQKNLLFKFTFFSHFEGIYTNLKVSLWLLFTSLLKYKDLTFWKSVFWHWLPFVPSHFLILVAFCPKSVSDLDGVLSRSRVLSPSLFFILVAFCPDVGLWHWWRFVSQTVSDLDGILSQSQFLTLVTFYLQVCFWPWWRFVP